MTILFLFFIFNLMIFVFIKKVGRIHVKLWLMMYIVKYKKVRQNLYFWQCTDYRII